MVLIHIPVAGPEKLPLLWGTLMTLIPQLTPGCTVRIVFNYEEDTSFAAINDSSALATIRALSSLGGSTVEYAFRPGLSVAAMYVDSAEHALGGGYVWLFKMDDDCLLFRFPVFLSSLSKYQECADYVTMNFWDIVNHRKYDDWRESVPVYLLPEMISEYGERTVWCHRWSGAQPNHIHLYSKECKVNASLFAINLQSANVDATLAELRKFKVGQRGMDLCAASNIGTRRIHLLSPYAIHLGVFRPQLDGKYWKEYQSPDAFIKSSKLQR